MPDFDRNVRSLLLTSAAPAEGKSTAIIHLAIAHAEQGKRTLIIDADLRRPSIHKKLNLDGTRGLSNALLGELDWKDGVAGTEDWPELKVLPAGTASRRASDLIGSLMIDILDEAAKDYDLILVDAPPIGFRGDNASRDRGRRRSSHGAGRANQSASRSDCACNFETPACKHDRPRAE